MSQENVGVVRQLVSQMLRAMRERDVEGFVDCFHPEAELLWPRNVLEGGSYKGDAGIRQAFADAFETWEDIRFELEEVHALHDGALILGRTVNVGKGDAPTVEYQSGYMSRLRDGKIVYWRPYQSHREALEAAGLSE